MKYFPFEKLTFESNLSPEQIKVGLDKRVVSKTQNKGEMMPGYKSKPYVGYITIDKFKINRIIRYQNSFKPFIKGTYNATGVGTQVKLTMQMSTAVIIFSIIWLTGVSIGALVSIVNLYTEATFNAMHLIPFAMILLFYLLTTLCFKYESLKSIKHLEEWFEAKALQD